MTDSLSLFPAFERFVVESHLDRAKGSLSAKLPRILGQGTTRADGMKDPPAPIERKAELAGLDFPPDSNPPPEVMTEVVAAKAEIDKLRAELTRPDGMRRFVSASLEPLEEPKGHSNGHYHAGRLILSSKRSGFEWAWSVTPHYPIVEKIPPDSDYVVRAFKLAQEKTRALLLSPDDFEGRLMLAWTMARRFSESDDVLIVDVMKMYQVAGQDPKFWQNPRRVYYKDLPEAAFVINLLNWRARAESAKPAFTFVPATLNQASGRNSKVFFMPMNAEGTEVRPMIFLRRI